MFYVFTSGPLLTLRRFRPRGHFGVQHVDVVFVDLPSALEYFRVHCQHENPSDRFPTFVFLTLMTRAEGEAALVNGRVGDPLNSIQIDGADSIFVETLIPNSCFLIHINPIGLKTQYYHCSSFVHGHLHLYTSDAAVDLKLFNTRLSVPGNIHVVDRLFLDLPSALDHHREACARLENKGDMMRETAVFVFIRLSSDKSLMFPGTYSSDLIPWRFILRTTGRTNWRVDSDLEPDVWLITIQAEPELGTSSQSRAELALTLYDQSALTLDDRYDSI